MKRILLPLATLLFSASGMSAQDSAGLIDVGLFKDQVFAKRAAAEFSELKTAQGDDKFRTTAENLKNVLKRAVSDASKLPETPANADTLRTTTREQIQNQLLLVEPPHDVAWITRLNALTGDLDNHIGGFDPNKVAHWIKLYQIAFQALHFAQTGETIEAPGAQPEKRGSIVDSVAKATVFADVDFAGQVYERLTELDVVKFDHKFPETAKKLVDVLQKLLDDADSNKPRSATIFAEAGIGAMADVIRKVDGPLARKQWREALVEFMGRLDKSDTFDRDSIADWRHAFSVLIDGLKKAIDEDTEYVKKLVEARTGSALQPTSSGPASTSGTIGTGVFSVWHARKMARIRRVHERKLYKIQSIRGY